MRISDWSSDVCSSDLAQRRQLFAALLYADLSSAAHRTVERGGAARADRRHAVYDALPALRRGAVRPGRAPGDVALVADRSAARRRAALYADRHRLHRRADRLYGARPPLRAATRDDLGDLSRAVPDRGALRGLRVRI